MVTDPNTPDTLPLVLGTSLNNTAHGNGSSDSFTYTVPAGGAHKALVVWLTYGDPQGVTFTVTQNGVTVPMTLMSNRLTSIQSNFLYGVLANPASGTFSYSASVAAHYSLTVSYNGNV